MANQKNTNVPFGGRSIYSRTLMTNLQQTIKYNRRAFHVTPKKDFLYLVAIGAVVTTGVSYLVFDHLHVKYKNQEVTQKSDKLIFGPHVLFDPKRDNIGIDIGSGYVKMANLLPQIGHSNRLPLSLKSADMNTIFKLRGDAPSDISSEYIIKTAESTICDVQALASEALGKDAGKDRLSMSSVVFSLPSYLSQSVRDSLLSTYSHKFKENQSSVIGCIRDDEAALLAILESGVLEGKIDDVQGENQYLLLVDVGAKVTQVSLYEGSISSEHFMGTNREKWIRPKYHSKLGYFHTCLGTEHMIDSIAENVDIEDRGMRLKIATQAMHKFKDDGQTVSINFKHNNTTQVVDISHEEYSDFTSKSMESMQKPISESLATLSSHMKGKGVLKVVYYGGGANSRKVTKAITSNINKQLSELSVSVDEVHLKDPQALVAVGTALAAKYSWVGDCDQKQK